MSLNRGQTSKGTQDSVLKCRAGLIRPNAGQILPVTHLWTVSGFALLGQGTLLHQQMCFGIYHLVHIPRTAQSLVIA